MCTNGVVYPHIVVPGQVAAAAAHEEEERARLAAEQLGQLVRERHEREVHAAAEEVRNCSMLHPWACSCISLSS